MPRGDFPAWQWERMPMLPYLLNAVYLGLLLFASPWIAWRAVSQGKYRQGLATRLLGTVPVRRSHRKCLWFHAVSVGEVTLIGPLLRRMAERHPEWECVVSTTTRAGMALARRRYPELASFYCPLDFTWAARAAMRRVRPDALVLVELELWPNLMIAAKAHGARVAVINGRLGDSSFRGYCRIRPLLRPLLRNLDLVAAQNACYAQRFVQLGARPEIVHVTGSMKFDGAEMDRSNPATSRLRELAGLQPGDIVFLAGSTQEPEEQAALAAFSALRDRWPNLRLILVPRHPERFDAVARLLECSGLAWQRRSRLESEGPRPEARILLVDTVGELGAWWGTAAIAFVGGSLGSRGGQNMMEPAAYGAAVCFGPNTWNFRDIVTAMLQCQAAAVVPDASALADFVRRCLEEPEYAASLGRQAQRLVASQLGATQRTLELLEPLVECPNGGAQPANVFAA